MGDLWAIVASTATGDWAGRARYAAAMALYQQGEMTAEVLEVYRICSRLDAEDALTVLALRGIGADWSARIRALRTAG
ncbi:MAG: hypothetical protein GC186_09675 [Rhodobacteraceae bacterium]|nr:hypothetical protein [Paracoccaceae bacterium]